MKSLMKVVPQAAERVELMSASDTPWALALSWSMLMCNCGVSSRLLGRTPRSSGSRLAMPKSWLRTAIRAWSRAGMIFQLQIEAGGIAQFLHRRRDDGEDLRVAIGEEMHHRAAGNGNRSVLAALALAPVLQMGEGHAGILARAGKGKGGHRKDEIDVRLFFVEIIFGHILRHFQGRRLGCAGRQRDQAEDETLVLVGQKAGGQAHEQER